MDVQPTATDLAGLPAFSSLTAEESQFVYYVEVVGLPLRKAASMAGLPVYMVSKPHLQQAREMLRREVRGNLEITREDVTWGLKEAIGQASILADPMAQIAGWNSIIKLHGLDAPQKIDINIHASMDVLKQHVRALSDDELVRLTGAGGIIDAEFYEVGHGKADAA